jgi:hypothetical protein
MATRTCGSVSARLRSRPYSIVLETNTNTHWLDSTAEKHGMWVNLWIFAPKTGQTFFFF